MGIFDALYNAVSGLQAQSYALQNISGNIANSQTTAYKRVDTSFSDLVQDGNANQQQAGSVLASSSPTNTVQGGIQNATTSTYMAINGSGYFVVQQPTNFSDNQPVFGGVDIYTRRGDFNLDKNGYLVNGAGNYLMGIPVDATTGNPVGSVPQVLQFNSTLIPAKATTQIQYQANLPSTPSTGSASAGVLGSDLLIPALYQANPIAGSPQPARITGINSAISPDKKAVGIGTATGLTNATTLSSLGLGTSDVLSISDGTNTTNYTVGAGDTVGDLITALTNPTSTAGKAAVTISLTPGGALQVQSNNFLDTVTMSDNAASPGADFAALGFAANATTLSPTNLLSQSAVASGSTLVVTVGANPPQTITFGTGAGQVSTLAGLQTALAGLSNVLGSVSQTTGNISLVATNLNDTIAVSGTANALKFGIQTLSAIPSNQTVVANDESTFISQSVSGGSITAYDGTGSPVDLTVRWAKIDSSSLGAGHTDTWNMFYQINSGATGTQSEWQNVGANFTFDSTGKMSPAISGLTLQNVNVDGTSLGNLQLVFGSNGLTQYANSSGSVAVNLMQQDGSAAGQLSGISVDDQGRIVGAYSNGKTVPLAQVTLANFNGANSLKQLDGGAYAATADSGPPIFNATGKVTGGALESSNTDIADEFSKLIVTQQAYSANTRIITTSNQMVQDLLNVLH
jgi:flagellar hook protein FlgE